MKSFMFGNSLIVHDPPAIPTPSDETTVPHWMVQLALASGFTYAADGQFGFLRNHAELPPSPQWGFDIVSSGWTGSFPSSDYTTILVTPANFIQYQPPDFPYEGENPTGASPLSAMLEIVDWVSAAEPGARIYLYENWPDMAGFVGRFPPSSQEFANYNSFTVSGFHDWWIEFQDQLLSARPDVSVRMIPVGPVISRLLTFTELQDIPVTELYEDDAPHGRPTIYFLAALVTFMATYGVEAPADFEVPGTVHPLVASNYSQIVEFVWSELQSFEDLAGNSRVF
jgi:hypothetical protein